VWGQVGLSPLQKRINNSRKMPSVATTSVRILIGALTIILGVGIKNYRELLAPGKRPDLDNNEYWGPKLKDAYKENKAVLPYDISVAPEVSR